MKRSSLAALFSSLLLLASCSREQSPAPAAPPSPSKPAVPAPDPRLEGLRNMDARLRKIRAQVRKEKKTAFNDDRSLFNLILKNFQSGDARDAAWKWITTAWDIKDAGPEPGELAWDDRIGLPTIAGITPRRLTINAGDDATIELIWIEPGMFTMGSPDTDVPRGPDETAHQALIPRGYWIAATEVTQGLWSRVMKSAPSYFRSAGPNAPVEQVSWYDAQYFILKLNMLIEENDIPWYGFMFHLPTETEWEYACRAGTTSPTYAGDIDLTGGNNAPALDPIAWYGGNAGVTYEGGWDASKWTGTQYAFATAGTHPVALKKPNAWGLYDTLGNVWEWCGDAYAPYPFTEIVDVDGLLTAGSNRVARGGSWGNKASSCRAAVRNPQPADARHPRIGFRLAASW